MKLSVFFLTMILVFNFSCTEKCPNKIELGEFYLSGKSKKLFPYQNGEKKLIFKDSLNNVLTFEIIASNEISLSESNWNETCTLNDSIDKQINVKAKKEWQTILLKPDSLINLSFNIFLKQEVDIDASDPDKIKEIDGLNIYRSNVAQMAIITDIKNTVLNNLPTEKVEYLEINEKKFYDLLKSRRINSGDIYYSTEKGIVIINENLGGFEKAKYWILDSIAYEK